MDRYGDEESKYGGIIFNTYDAILTVLNELPDIKKNGGAPKKNGCTVIMDNVFIGAGTSIMYSVRIGPNVIVGAHSVITKDFEPNSVYAGIPARKVGTFDDYVAKRKNNKSIIKTNQHITKEEVDNAWRIFDEERRWGKIWRARARHLDFARLFFFAF